MAFLFIYLGISALYCSQLYYDSELEEMETDWKDYALCFAWLPALMYNVYQLQKEYEEGKDW